MTITTDMIKALREKSGAGMMDCKKALAENGGDLDKAMNWLREKGIASAMPFFLCRSLFAAVADLDRLAVRGDVPR